MLSSSVFAGDFGAIAYSRSNNKSGISNNLRTLEAAKDEALRACEGADCEIVVSGRNKYFSLASSDENEIGAGIGESIDEAVRTAFEACRAKSNTCRWRLYVGSHGQAGESYVVAPKGPDAPKLGDIGGPFSKTIENFSGFRQLQKQWCWAAVAQTIYYALTGARVNQSLIARVKVDIGPSTLKLVERTVTVRRVTCGGDSGKRKICNQPGEPVTALKILGVAPRASELPTPLDTEAIYLKIRESLQRNIPVGIAVTWYTGFAHAVIVFGADYSFDKNSADGRAQISLKVFDPADGGIYIIKGNRFLPNYDIVPGVFTGWITLADYKNPAARQVQSQACEFMDPNQQRMFCPNFNAAAADQYHF